MEHAQNEINAVAEAIADIDSQLIHELTDAQLALIGGGVGEISPY
jgi:hypothetical protein